MKKVLTAVVLAILVAPVLALADGLADFNANCARCHGGSLETNARRALAFKVNRTKLYLPYSEMDKAQMTAIVENGKNKMPAFKGKLTKDQTAGIVDYVKSLNKK
jgi:cytochrome c6